LECGGSTPLSFVFFPLCIGFTLQRATQWHRHSPHTKTERKEKKRRQAAALQSALRARKIRRSS
jgi:hypothetical protein